MTPLAHCRRHAFTLVELLVVLIVISVLIGFTTTRVTKAIDSSQNSAARASLANVYKSSLAYYTDSDESFGTTAALITHLTNDGHTVEPLTLDGSATSGPNSIGVRVYGSGGSVFMKRVLGNGTTHWLRYVSATETLSTSWTDGGSIPTIPAGSGFVTGSQPGIGAAATPTAIRDWGGAIGAKDLIHISGAHLSGGLTTCAVADDYKAYCWGSDQESVLGDGGAEVTRADPAQVTDTGVLAGKTIVKVATGVYHACALDSDGAAYCWGRNARGQLGTGDNVAATTPVAVKMDGALSGKSITDIEAGMENTCAIADGRAYCWGENTGGILGDNSAIDRNEPTAVFTGGVLGSKTVTDISLGSDATCAVADGSAYCWGSDGWGQLGNGAGGSSTAPVAVDDSGALSGLAVTAIASGQQSNCAIAGGRSYCWGYNGMNNFGDAGAAGGSSTIPTATSVAGVLSGETLTDITAGLSHYCVLNDGGDAFCWGSGGAGQLGDGGSANSAVPVAVDMSGALAGMDIDVIAGGASSTHFIAATP